MLPSCVTDVEDLRIAISGRSEDRKARERVDVGIFLSEWASGECVKKYNSIFNRSEPIDRDTFAAIGAALLDYSSKVEKLAKDRNEWERYEQIERPVAGYLVGSAAVGIAISTDNLRRHKQKIDHEYYMALKKFSAAYGMPLEPPSDAAVINYLEPKGFDFSGVNVDYVLDFVPMSDGFATDLVRLRKIARSRKVLSAMPLSQERIFPIVDWFGSITSRIYFKDPSLQNLAKTHRDILVPDAGKVLSYVDYDQYEAGIMAALSGDQELLKLYSEGDVYELAAEQIFRDRGRRKEAKRLFLSYAYGMRRKSLVDAAVGYGADRAAAKSFFDQFRVLEDWKEFIWQEFKTTSRIGTKLGNYLSRYQIDETSGNNLRKVPGDLSSKEKRSAVSQVVQGTASLIFKKALLELRNEAQVELKVPMHDAVLFQHPMGFNPAFVVDCFARVLSEHFGGIIVGKASLAQFVRPQEKTPNLSEVP